MGLFSIGQVSAIAEETGRVELRVVGEDDTELPCRIHLYDKAGKAVRAPGLPFWRDHFVCPGTVELDLQPGRYRFEIERGPEFRRQTGQVDVVAGKTKELNVKLRRLINLASQGWFSGDLHVHRPISEIELLMKSEDLNIAPVITWWNNRNLWKQGDLPSRTLKSIGSNRFYDVMAGEDEREGGALLFFHLKRPLEITGSTREFPSPMKFVAEARKNKNVWIDIEKPFWWDVPIWLASGHVNSIGIANNHMCRSQMYESEAWGRPRDSNQLPAPRGNGYWTQEIYYHILNSGLRIPPSAGSASGVLPNPVGYNRVYVYTGKEFSYQSWWEGLKAGRSFVTNGPLLLAKANGQVPGSIFRATRGGEVGIQLSAEIVANDNVPQIEIIKNGKVVRSVAVESIKNGNLGMLKFQESGWFLLRAITDNKRTFRFASTAPFFVEIGDQRISRRSVKFFIDWIDERMQRVPLKLKDKNQLKEVLEHHQAAKRFWQDRLRQANAD
jgi:hypothetical protein